ncbi:hypothetical protein M405DRAFT_831032 [Rhizopogon salebrosus TDB-379]|nr:hypothetical protein M405DRAFT_831032 [Rhizopogon salebrosus TDB-379]
MGVAHIDFIRFLAQTDDETSKGMLGSTSKPLYAKAISVVQSPGMGKSRMMTEVGRAAFTLPICLRHPEDLGYPPADDAV